MKNKRNKSKVTQNEDDKASEQSKNQEVTIDQEFDNFKQKHEDYQKLIVKGWEILMAEKNKLDEEKKKHAEMTKKIENFHLTEQIDLNIGN